MDSYPFGKCTLPDRQPRAGGFYIHVIADDLTGSADTANYFRDERHRVRLVAAPMPPWEVDLGPEVVQVYDTESRSLSVSEATLRMLDVSRALARHRPLAMVYQKVDSTLRGNVGAEVEAALSGLRRTIAVLAPSFPENGRTVRDGVLYVHHRPINETAFARDPLHPARLSSVREVLVRTTGLPIVDLPLSVVRGGTSDVGDFLRQVRESQSQVIVVADAESVADLEVLAAAVGLDNTYLPCGSAGFAKALAGLWLKEAVPDGRLVPPPGERSQTHSPYIQRQVPRPSKVDRVLVVVGSANALSQEQVQILVKNATVKHLVLNPEALVGRGIADCEWTRLASEWIRAAKEMTVSAAQVVALSLRQTNGSHSAWDDSVDTACMSRALVDSLARVAAHIINAWQLDGIRFGIVATGGDTAAALCRALDVSSLWPEGELFRGVPWSVAFSQSQSTGFTLVSKAGGFGASSVFLDVVQMLLEAPFSAQGE